MRRGVEFAIMLGRTELMNSRRSGSEKRWRRWPRKAPEQAATSAIGGLAWASRCAPPGRVARNTRVTVAELVPSVVPGRAVR